MDDLPTRRSLSSDQQALPLVIVVPHPHPVVALLRRYCYVLVARPVVQWCLWFQRKDAQRLQRLPLCIVLLALAMDHFGKSCLTVYCNISYRFIGVDWCALREENQDVDLRTFITFPEDSYTD
jgi:hypothetical protein